MSRHELLVGTPPQRYMIPPGVTEIGRDPSCGICIDAPSVSRCHAVLERNGDEVVATNRSTSSPMRVDGVVSDYATLSDGTRLQLGQIQAIYHTTAAKALAELELALEPAVQPSLPIVRLPRTTPAASRTRPPAVTHATPAWVKALLAAAGAMLLVIAIASLNRRTPEPTPANTATIAVSSSTLVDPLQLPPLSSSTVLASSSSDTSASSPTLPESTSWDDDLRAMARSFQDALQRATVQDASAILRAAEERLAALHQRLAAETPPAALAATVSQRLSELADSVTQAREAIAACLQVTTLVRQLRQRQTMLATDDLLVQREQLLKQRGQLPAHTPPAIIAEVDYELDAIATFIASRTNQDSIAQLLQQLDSLSAEIELLVRERKWFSAASRLAALKQRLVAANHDLDGSRRRALEQYEALASQLQQRFEPLTVLPPAEAIERAIERGIVALRNQQRSSGAWYESHIGATSLALLALLENGVPATDPALRKAFEHLRTKQQGKVYDVALYCMALSAVNEQLAAGRPLRRCYLTVPQKRALQEATQRLIDGEHEGYFGYHCDVGANAKRWDNSNSQVAVLGLRAAEQAGIDVPVAVWRRVLEYWIDSQHRVPANISHAGAPPRGWSYVLEGEPTDSMSAAGVASLTIAIEQLTLEKALPADLEQRATEALASGLAWIAQGPYCRDPLNDATTRHVDGYLLYGLERVGMLTGTARFGEVDWYITGARRYVLAQHDDGSWSGRYDTAVETALALIFLRRATRPSAVAITRDSSER